MITFLKPAIYGGQSCLSLFMQFIDFTRGNVEIFALFLFLFDLFIYFFEGKRRRVKVSFKKRLHLA